LSVDRRSLDLPHGRLQLPVFLPDATMGVVRSVDATDLVGCKVQAMVMNTFHLAQHPGSSTIQALGGLHKMSGWQGPIVTDSGGFQAYSLIRQNPRYGQMSERGITFRVEGSDRKFQLTPEKAVQLQLSYGSDIVICLDDCTHVEASLHVQEEAVRRTVAWARRCKAEFQRILDQKGTPRERRPLLFAVIQGGGDRELRKRCAGELLEMGFDGYGYGGWPLDEERNLLLDIIAYTRELVPPEYPMHALGVGHPANILECARIGYGLFDSSMPTRDARHGRLYLLTFPPASQPPAAPQDDIAPKPAPSGFGEGWFSYLYVNDAKHIKAGEPVSGSCDCLCCSNYSRGYLRHLFKINDGLFQRLATIHNLRSMTRLTERL
jgi:queuine tRNA-ribosyltransferase